MTLQDLGQNFLAIMRESNNPLPECEALYERYCEGSTESEGDDDDE